MPKLTIEQEIQETVSAFGRTTHDFYQTHAYSSGFYESMLKRLLLKVPAQDRKTALKELTTVTIEKRNLVGI